MKTKMISMIAALAAFASFGVTPNTDFQDIQELTPGDSSGVIKERFNQMLRRIKGTVAAVAAVVGFAVWAELGPDTIMNDVSGTNTVREVVQAAGIGGAVDSVNGKTGRVELIAADVHALPDTYTPPAAPVQSVNSKTGAVQLNAGDVGAVPSGESSSSFTLITSSPFMGGSSTAFSNTGVYHAPIPEREFDIGDVDYFAWDWLKFSGVGLGSWIYSNYVPTTRRINGQPLTSDITIQAGVTSVNSKTGAVTLDAGDVGAASAADVQTLNIGYTRLYNFNTGATNANFTATNYPPTKAEADARCHWQPESGMDFSTVPASLQLNEKRDGEWRTVVDTRDWTVWYYKFKEVQLTNELARLRAENAVLSNKVESAKAWGGRTANGIENPLDDTVVVDRPNMWLMADYEWQKCVSGSNQCFVLRAKNVALSGGANTNGFLEVCDAFGKAYMRINKSAETFADPVFDEIYYDHADGAWYVVFSNSTKPTKGGANVAIRGNGDGKCILFEETDPECPAVITWPNVPESHSGHWIMKAVPKPVNGVVPRAMFFGAEIKVPGSDYVEYLKEASFGAGVRFGNNVYDYVESGDQLILRKRQ